MSTGSGSRRAPGTSALVLTSPSGKEARYSARASASSSPGLVVGGGGGDDGGELSKAGLDPAVFDGLVDGGELEVGHRWFTVAGGWWTPASTSIRGVPGG